MDILKTLVDNFETDIQKVINGKIEEASSELLSPGHINEYLNSLGTHNSDFESNGWEYDHWASWEIDGENYVLSGSGFYGGLAFSKADY